MNKWMQEIGQEILGPFSQLDPESPHYPTSVNLQQSFLWSVLKRSIPGPRKSRGTSSVNGSWVYLEGDAQHGILVARRCWGQSTLVRLPD